MFIKGKIHQDKNLSANHLCSKCKTTHIHKRNFIKAQNTHCTPHINSGRLQHPTLTNGQVIETELNRDTVKLREVINQMDLTDIYRIFHPISKEYIFFSPHSTFSKIDQIIGQKTTLNGYKKIEIKPCIPVPMPCSF